MGCYRTLVMYPFTLSPFAQSLSQIFPIAQDSCRTLRALRSNVYLPRENNVDGRHLVRLYAPVDKMTGSKSRELPAEAKVGTTAEDIMKADRECVFTYLLV